MELGLQLTLGGFLLLKCSFSIYLERRLKLQTVNRKHGRKALIYGYVYGSAGMYMVLPGKLNLFIQVIRGNFTPSPYCCLLIDLGSGRCGYP
uniref:Uncharacterized protein n=2 Tax=Picea TaxID=3328 RepID=A0A101M4G6_PICGL|nr:hypothetical protein ABT39_MTgene618 [Picea glauca]QHR92774.1 hypothetical protein Q903MT_gene6822 [Picea sitchensis]